MKERRSISLPVSLLPGSPEAVAHVVALIGDVAGGGDTGGRRDVGRGGISWFFAEAWTIAALPARRAWLLKLAKDGRLEVGEEWVRLDSHCPEAFRAANRAIALHAIEAIPGAKRAPPPPAPDEVVESHGARAGLCNEQRCLADRLAERLAADGEVGMSIATDGEVDMSQLAALLPALSPAGIGGFGSEDAEAHALQLLRSACTAAGLEPDRIFRATGGELFGSRVPARSYESAGLSLSWSRSRGLAWQAFELRESLGLFSLEVQGDRGGRGAFVPGHPVRSRVFEVAHMRPVRETRQRDVAVVELERELKLPEDPEQPKGRGRYVKWELSIRIDVAEPRLEVGLVLDGLAPGQRYRLWTPVPFYPRSTRVALLEPDGAIRTVEREGAFATLPVFGHVELEGKGCTLAVAGPGLREVEILPRANDHVLAITLARVGKAAVPQHRTFSLAWRSLTMGVRPDALTKPR